MFLSLTPNHFKLHHENILGNSFCDRHLFIFIEVFSFFFICDFQRRKRIQRSPYPLENHIIVFDFEKHFFARLIFLLPCSERNNVYCCLLLFLQLLFWKKKIIVFSTDAFRGRIDNRAHRQIWNKNIPESMHLIIAKLSLQFGFLFGIYFETSTRSLIYKWNEIWNFSVCKYKKQTHETKTNMQSNRMKWNKVIGTK